MKPKINGDKQWKKDDMGRFTEGNPGGGRPPGAGISITTEIKRKLGEIPEGSKRTYLELLISRIMKEAVVDGDKVLISKIWAYIDGMPKESKDIAMTVEGGPSLSAQVIEAAEEALKKKKLDDTE